MTVETTVLTESPTNGGPPVVALESQGVTLRQDVAAIEVVDAPSFERAAEALKLVKGYLARVAEVFDPIDRAQIEARKVTIAQRKALEAHALDAEKILKQRMAAWQEAQEQARREAEAAAAREAQRLAEEQQLQAAIEAEQLGDTAAAEQILAAPPVPVIMPPVVVSEAPQVAGVSFRDHYRAEVTDLLALVRAIAAGKAPITLVQPNTAALGQMARALKGAMQIPGVRVTRERITAARSA